MMMAPDLQTRGGLQSSTYYRFGQRDLKEGVQVPSLLCFN